MIKLVKKYLCFKRFSSVYVKYVRLERSKEKKKLAEFELTNFSPTLACISVAHVRPLDYEHMRFRIPNC